MRAEFRIKREQQREVFFTDYVNIGGDFNFHSNIELHFVDEGEVEVFINDKKKILCAGEMSVALSYDPHCYISVGKSKSSVLIIPIYMCEEFIAATQNMRAKNNYVCDRETVSKIKGCFNEIRNCGDNQIKKLGYIYVILGHLMEHMALEEVHSKIDHDLSSRLLFYINENFKSDISLASISSELGYNPSYISRYFKNCFNMGVNQYINIMRLREAVMLMSDKKHNITYCALEAGFNSMRTFYRVFVNEFHCTPKEHFENEKANK